MTQKEIIEGCKLIAEFDGMDDWYEEYYTQWSWIMPVVEKIESTEKDVYFGFSVRIEDKYCSIKCHQKDRQPGLIYQSPYGFEPTSKIEAVWLAVIEFIKWYKINK